MTEYKRVSLIDALNKSEESAVFGELSSFSSLKNKDIESFLKNSAVQFAKQNIAPTTLVYIYSGNRWNLCGYFTLTIKTIDIEKESVGSGMFKKVKKFGTYDSQTHKCTIPVPLIAQLGKNYADNCNKLIKGSELLTFACNEVRKAQRIIGGKVVYLECEDTPKLINFYRNNGFREFSRRSLDPDEQGNFKSRYLIQMLKYLD